MFHFGFHIHVPYYYKVSNRLYEKEHVFALGRKKTHIFKISVMEFGTCFAMCTLLIF